jgi:hypothetical protein
MTDQQPKGRPKTGPRPKVVPIKPDLVFPAPKPKHSPARRAACGLTIKQERFCQVYAKEGNATAAYKQVYNAGNMKPAVINQKAFELTSNAKITVRVEAIRAAIAKQCAVTVDTLSADLDEAMNLARQANQPGAFVQAVMAKAKLHGMIVEKVESKQTQFVVSAPIPAESTEDWLAGLEAKPA